jgi:hypothetical protein
MGGGGGGEEGGGRGEGGGRWVSSPIHSRGGVMQYTLGIFMKA